MRSKCIFLATVTIGLAGGCSDDTPPPRASIPPVGTYTVGPQPVIKPLPDQDLVVPSIRLVSPAVPEQAAFVTTYERVGRPRIGLIVRRTPGVRVDFDAIESAVAESISAGGRVMVASPKVDESQAARLEQDAPDALAALAKDFDVLIQVRPQAAAGQPEQLVAEALNTRDSDVLGRVFADAPPASDKAAATDTARFLTRRLMSDVTQTWNKPRPPAATQPQ